MNQPLGNTAGLWCEVLESVECLKGNGPSDLMQVVYHLGQKALDIAGIENSKEKLKSNIKNGKALKKFKEMVIAHGGETEMFGTPQLHEPEFRKEIFAKEDGFIVEMDTLQLGQAVVQLGGGRIQKNDKIDYSTGILFHRKIGEFIEKGTPFLEYFCSDPVKFKSGGNLLKNIFTIQTQKPNIPPLFY
jgi:pyrimidine-nucleoside phosphorylase